MGKNKNFAYFYLRATKSEPLTLFYFDVLKIKFIQSNFNFTQKNEWHELINYIYEYMILFTINQWGTSALYQPLLRISNFFLIDSVLFPD